MIKILKHGMTTLKMICPYCGCEFTYEKEDIKVHTVYTSYNFVICPDCENECYMQFPDITSLKPIEINFDHINTLDCNQCPWNNWTPNNDFRYVGDTPCTWCKKRQLTCNNINMGYMK